MPRPQIYALALFFGAAYVFFLFMVRPDREVSAGLHVAASSASVATVSTSDPIRRAKDLAAGRTDQQQPNNNVASGSDEAQQEAAHEQLRLVVEAISESNPEVRGEAIQRLAAGSTSDAVHALSEAALRDRDPRNRYLAIESLRALAANSGDGDGAVRSVLQTMMQDRDAEFASHARAAYRDVVEFAGVP